jgi:hypothetical protein
MGVEQLRQRYLKYYTIIDPWFIFIYVLNGVENFILKGKCSWAYPNRII